MIRGACNHSVCAGFRLRRPGALESGRPRSERQCFPKESIMKKSADQWFAEYGECHHNTVNEVIHWICIPAITLSLLGLLWSVPMPSALGGAALYVNLASLFIVAAILFYLRLSPPLAIGMFVLAALFFALVVAFSKL